MDPVTLLGTVAGALTTVSFVPQVVKTWRTRSGGDISYGMFALFAAGVLLWLLYGLAIHSPPVVAANGITLVLALTVLALKFRFGRAPRRGRRTPDAPGPP